MSVHVCACVYVCVCVCVVYMYVRVYQYLPPHGRDRQHHSKMAKVLCIFTDCNTPQ